MMAAQQQDFRPPARDELQPGAVGRLLREAREGYRQDIATVSQQLRIRGVYLKAIEDGHYQDLPGSTYAVGFVRSYAEYLGLDANEIVRRFRDEDAEVNRRTRLVFPMPAVEARVPGGALLLIALIVAVVAYGGWYYLSDRERSLVDLVPAVPESLKEFVDSAGEPVGEVASDDDSAPAVSVATADAASVTPSEDTETDAPAVATATATESTAATAFAAASQPASADGASAVSPALEPAGTMNIAGTQPQATGALQSEATTAADATAAATDAASSSAISAGVADTGSAALEPVVANADPVAETVAPAAASAADTTATAASAAATETAAASSAEPAAQQMAAIPEAPRVPDSTQDSQSYGIAFGGSRVVIVARMESFLRVRDEAGNEIFSHILRSGDRYLVPERPGLTLSVGNAGGVDIFVDGNKAPALGVVGVGVTGISLDPERLKAGTALP
jgi:cytoskeleton protein RodZ